MDLWGHGTSPESCSIVNVQLAVEDHLQMRLMPTVRVPLRNAPFEELCRDAEQVRLAKEDGTMHKGQISFLVAATALEEARLLWKKPDQWTNPTLVLYGSANLWTDCRQNKRLSLIHI